MEHTDAAGSSDENENYVEDKENDAPSAHELAALQAAAAAEQHARAPAGALQELTVDTQHMDEEEKAEFEAYCRQAEEALRNAAGNNASSTATTTTTRDPFVVYGDTDPDAPAAAAAAAAELAVRCLHFIHFRHLVPGLVRENAVGLFRGVKNWRGTKLWLRHCWNTGCAGGGSGGSGGDVRE